MQIADIVSVSVTSYRDTNNSAYIEYLAQDKHGAQEEMSLLIGASFNSEGFGSVLPASEDETKIWDLCVKHWANIYKKTSWPAKEMREMKGESV